MVCQLNLFDLDILYRRFIDVRRTGLAGVCHHYRFARLQAEGAKVRSRKNLLQYFTRFLQLLGELFFAPEFCLQNIDVLLQGLTHALDIFFRDGCFADHTQEGPGQRNFWYA